MKTKSFWTLFALLVFAATLAVFYLPGYSRYNELKEKEQKLADEITRLEQENLRLKQEQVLLERDVTRLEEAMRTQLGKVKPGEVVYRVVEVPPVPPKEKN